MATRSDTPTPMALKRPVLVVAAVLVLMAVQTARIVLRWTQADERSRRIMAETAALAFVACQAALFVSAAAEGLSLVDPVSTWARISIAMGVCLLAAARLGFHLSLRSKGFPS